jgi:hypothetical protein
MQQEFRKQIDTYLHNHLAPSSRGEWLILVEQHWPAHTTEELTQQEAAQLVNDE